MRLYLVIREPQSYNGHLRALCWHTQAKSKADALRQFRNLEQTHTKPDYKYCAPRAALVMPGAHLFYI